MKLNSSMAKALQDLFGPHATPVRYHYTKRITEAAFRELEFHGLCQIKPCHVFPGVFEVKSLAMLEAEKANAEKSKNPLA